MSWGLKLLSQSVTLQNVFKRATLLCRKLTIAKDETNSYRREHVSPLPRVLAGVAAQLEL